MQAAFWRPASRPRRLLTFSYLHSFHLVQLRWHPRRLGFRQLFRVVASSKAYQALRTNNADRFEFFMWPSYMTNISLTLPCVAQFDRIYGKRTPIRIGGTTQDRATFDPNFAGYVSYTTPDPLIAPMQLSFGPRFFDLISEFLSKKAEARQRLSVWWCEIEPLLITCRQICGRDNPW